MFYLYTKVIHLSFVALWIGSMALIFFQLNNMKKGADNIQVAGILHNSYKYVSLPSFVFSLVSGIVFIIDDTNVMKSGWFYTKMFVLIILIICFIWQWHKIKELSLTDMDSTNYTIALILMLTATLSIMTLVILKPF